MLRKKSIPKEIKSQSFLQGAFILAASMIIVKTFGMVYKIILANMFGGVGTGLFNAAYALYNPLFMLATAGFPIAISRMVSESVANGRYKDVKKIHRVSVPIFIVTGCVCFLLMIGGSFIYVNLIKTPNAIFAILALAPTVLFGCLMSIYRGYFEGMRNMVPTAISEIIEATFKLFVGLTMAYLTIKFGTNQYETTGYVLGMKCSSLEQATDYIMPIAVGAAITGISLGGIMGFVFLYIRYRKNGDGITQEDLASSPRPRSDRETIKILVRTAIPVGMGAILLSITDVIDTSIVQSRIYDIMQTNPEALLNVYGTLLPDSVYYAGTTHTYLFGCYGYSSTLTMLITALTQVFGSSALPSVTAAWASKDKAKLKQSLEAVLRITLVVTIPSGIGLSVLSEPILGLIYSSPNVSNEVEIASKVLTTMGIAIIFVGTATPVCSMLQAVGRVDLPVKLMAIGVVAKIITNYVLVGIPEINIQGAPIGTFVCYLFISVVGVFFLCRHTKIVPNFMSILVKPLLASLVCGVGAFVSYHLFNYFMSGKIATILAVIVAIIVYIFCLFIFKAIQKDDVLQMPKGAKIARFLERKGVF